VAAFYKSLGFTVEDRLSIGKRISENMNNAKHNDGADALSRCIFNRLTAIKVFLFLFFVFIARLGSTLTFAGWK
jgi:hypothetical protein